jgi:hypothetical protein
VTDHLDTVEHIAPETAACIRACAECQELCLATVQHCLRAGGAHATPELIRTLLDCAKGCETARDFMLRGSALQQGYCRGCAHACGSCASACEKFPDDDAMAACAQGCRRAMEACRAVGGPSRH